MPGIKHLEQGRQDALAADKEHRERPRALFTYEHGDEFPGSTVFQ